MLALTFAPVPDTGVFDTDMLYRLLVNPHARLGAARPATTGAWPPSPATSTR